MARLMKVGLALLMICVLASLYAVDKAACLELLNKIRVAHDAEPVEWDPYLEKHAMRWASFLATNNMLEHDSKENLSDKQGESLYMSTSGPARCMDALKHWYKQFQIYKARGACASPPENGVPGTDDFTHMVWKSTNKVAVAVVGKVVVARFFPPGNFEGDYESDVEC